MHYYQTELYFSEFDMIGSKNFDPHIQCAGPRLEGKLVPNSSSAMNSIKEFNLHPSMSIDV
jgi:hypothetical protein